MSRADTRKQEKAVQAALRRGGLPPERDFALLFAHTSNLRRILGQGSNAARAQDAARHHLDALNRSLRQQAGAFSLECTKGCSYCCHNMVTASAPEIFLLARHFRKAAPAHLQKALEKLRAADEAGRDLDPRQRYLAHIGCGLLDENGLCTAYEARPNVCRTMVSASVAACRASFDGEPAQIPVPKPYGALRTAYSYTLLAALRAEGLDDRLYELNQALRTALETENAERRWLSGEDIFAGIQHERIDADCQPEAVLFLSVLAAGAEDGPLPANPWITR
ncbi:YkgJ family cysteine cluster protein [Oceanibaculum sp.]|uniref:YkgJ family cysteine cluster protein n=1 Tax=Oceanibaculum sp. TaxID=1903597 RepID=UPI002585216B|nr:YkgJ family cysteine cluster protein [Oceanibaculum sp.]MCH2395491.1 YkgJ family cysteine cluster protein [Oceanibaculum sp.]